MLQPSFYLDFSNILFYCPIDSEEMKVKYQYIEKGHRDLVEFISALPQLKKNSRGKYDEFFKGIEQRSWEEFNSAIEELNKYLEDKGIISDNKPHLYRGQCCGKWKLETTLERYTGKTYTVENYLRLIQSAKLAFDSHFGKGYKTEETNPIIKAKFSPPAPHPHYPLLTYFRHLGFPSPLLDWHVYFIQQLILLLVTQFLRIINMSLYILTVNFLEIQSGSILKGLFAHQEIIFRPIKDITYSKQCIHML